MQTFDNSAIPAVPQLFLLICFQSVVPCLTAEAPSINWHTHTNMTTNLCISIFQIIITCQACSQHAGDRPAAAAPAAVTTRTLCAITAKQYCCRASPALRCCSHTHPIQSHCDSHGPLRPTVQPAGAAVACLLPAGHCRVCAPGGAGAVHRLLLRVLPGAWHCQLAKASAAA